MNPFTKNNENRQKAHGKERLSEHEKPLVRSYEHVVDVAVGVMFDQFSRIPDPRAAKFGAPVVEQAANQPAAMYPKDITNPFASDKLELDPAAIRQHIQELAENV